MLQIDTDFAKSRMGMTLGGRYHVEDLIAVGGTACVYRGRHRNGNRVAVKVLHPIHSLNADIRERFAKEGYAANAVEHPRAVRVLDDDVVDGVPFLVMELLEGETVEARWQGHGRALPVDEVVSVACDVLEVLVAAHAKGIIHRDIKPENLFLTRWGELKILDFGIARFRNAAGAALTSTGSIPGTPAFMAREQALGFAREIDARTDLWALGATMFTLLSGKHVHEAETVEQMLVFAASEPARSLAAVAPDVPAEIVTIVDRALSIDKDDRYPDAQAMLDALSPLRKETRLIPIAMASEPSQLLTAPADEPRQIASTTGALSTVTSPDSTRRRSVRGLAVMLGGVAIVVAIGATLVTRASAPRSEPVEKPSAAAAPEGSTGATALTSEPPASAAVAGAGSSKPVVSAAAAPSAYRPSPQPRGQSDARLHRSAAPRPATSTSTDPPPSVGTNASPDCNPPVYIDPVTSTRRVRPGCD